MCSSDLAWQSRLQTLVATSTAEAEYLAFAAATKEAMYLRNVLQEIGLAQEEPTTVYEDNQPCIAIATNPMTTGRTKHIQLRYHFVRDAVIDRIVNIVYCPTKDMVADFLTKILAAAAAAPLFGIAFGR